LGSFSRELYFRDSVSSELTLDPAADNPIVPSGNVTPNSYTHAADPMPGDKDGRVYVFFEAFNSGSEGKVAYLSSPDGRTFLSTSEATVVLVRPVPRLRLARRRELTAESYR
jgi:hypothetical protein